MTREMPLSPLKRIRWAVRAVLALGVAASAAANILHANPNPVSQIIAGWPPLALLVTVELISRVPMHRRSLAAVRLLSTTAIAGIAAWVSYWHMAGVAARYGETGASPYLLPLSVDGLVIVASVCLVELAGRIRDVQDAAAVTDTPVSQPAAEPVMTPATQSDPRPDAPRPSTRTQRRPAGRPSAAAKVARAAAKMPDAPVDKIAARAGVSTKTARRHLAAKTPDTAPATEHDSAADKTPDTPPVNGADTAPILLPAGAAP